MGQVSSSMIKMAIKFVDKNGDGKIGFDEFQQIRSRLPV